MNVKMNAKLFLIAGLIFLIIASFASAASLTVKTGWNLIHLPDGLGTCTSSDFEFQGTQVVFGVNVQGSGWELKTLSSSLPDSKGVFLLKATPGDCDITVNEDYSNLNAALSAGWNVLPISQDMLSKGLFEIRGTCQIQHVYYSIPLSFSTQQWFSINTGTADNPVSLQSQGMQANTAIIIQVSNNCSLNSQNLQPPLPPVTPDSRNLTVTVTNNQGIPVEGASVRIARASLESAVGSSSIITGSTNASGIAVLQVPTGWTGVGITVEKQGFQTHSGIAGIAATGDVSLGIIVLQPATTTPQASLTVKVFNAFDNSIIANATVKLYSLASAAAGGETLVETKPSPSTGLTTFTGLTVGQYYFASVSKQNFSTRSSSPIQAINGINEVSIYLNPVTTFNLQCSFKNITACASSLKLDGIRPNPAKTSVSYQNNALAMTGTNHLVYSNLVERLDQDTISSRIVPIVDKNGTLEMKIVPLNWQASSIIQKVLFYAQDTTSSMLSQLSIRVFGELPKSLVDLQNSSFYPLARGKTLHVIAGQSYWRGAPYVIKQYDIANWFGTSSTSYEIKLEWNDSSELLDLYINGVKQVPLSVVYGKSFNTATSAFNSNPTPEQRRFDFLQSNFQEFSVGSYIEQINEVSGSTSTPTWLASNVQIHGLAISGQTVQSTSTTTPSN